MAVVQVAQVVQIPHEEGDARRHEIFLLVFSAEEALVDLSQKALYSHNQKKDLHQAKVLKLDAEIRHEIQRQKDRDMEVDAARKGLRFEALIGRVFEGTPERGVEP